MVTWIIFGLIVAAAVFAVRYAARKAGRGECVGCSGCKGGHGCPRRTRAENDPHGRRL